jgi:hypothetical protein
MINQLLLISLARLALYEDSLWDALLNLMQRIDTIKVEVPTVLVKLSEAVICYFDIFKKTVLIGDLFIHSPGKCLLILLIFFFFIILRLIIGAFTQIKLKNGILF